MEQKRFLTADEVFQIFGVDAETLEGLVTSGAVQALADMGSFKYRSEDFVTLVQNGTITPRTSGELFQADSDGEIPFLKEKGDEDAVRLHDDVSYIELDEAALAEHAIPDSDSDVRIVANQDEQESMDIPVMTDELLGDKGVTETLDLSDIGRNLTDDSDSDVRIAVNALNLGGDDNVTGKSVTESEIKLPGESEPSGILVMASPSDSDVKLVTPDQSDSDVKVVGFDAGQVESHSTHEIERTHSRHEFPLAPPEGDSGISLIGADSGIRLSDEESGIRLADEDSGIRLDNADSGISLADVGTNSGISLAGGDSGISLASPDADSGISLVGADSGISLVSADADSGISLVGADSGISLVGADGDSGIRLVNDDTSEGDIFDPTPAKTQNEGTQTLDLSDELTVDSGFDVSLADEENTTELNVGRGSTPAYPKTTAAPKQKTTSQPPVLSLSETFKLDEPPEVEDLDISDDLEDAQPSDASDEFASVEEDEVFEASDDAFGADDVSVAEDDEFSESELVAPAPKARKGPKEPEWGALAVAPIGVAAVTLLATALTLFGGVATMWTGGEAPGPLGALISTLAGLSPF